MHMAIGGVVNAAWDLRARLEASPSGRCSPRLTPAEIVAQVDFTYIDDALTPERSAGPPRRRPATARQRGSSSSWPTACPPTRPRRAGSATTTTRSSARSRPAVADGLHDAQAEGRTRHRGRHAPAQGGAGCGRRGRRASPSTPTSAGGSTRPSTGWRSWPSSTPTGSRSRPRPTTSSVIAAIRGRCARSGSRPASTSQNRVIFKQLLQAEAIDVVQIDACRVGGVNENLAILLLAAKFGVPVCPHAGGVGLCEMVQHLAMFDFVAVSGSDRRPLDRVRRPPPRALRDTRRRDRRPLPRAHGARRRRSAARRHPQPLRLPLRLGVDQSTLTPAGRHHVPLVRVVPRARAGLVTSELFRTK